MVVKKDIKKDHKTDYEKAIKDDPAGVVCNKCGQLNDLWDDIGWFYEEIPEDNKGIRPVCSKCTTTPPGDR